MCRAGRDLDERWPNSPEGVVCDKVSWRGSSGGIYVKAKVKLTIDYALPEGACRKKKALSQGLDCLPRGWQDIEKLLVKISPHYLLMPDRGWAMYMAGYRQSEVRPDKLNLAL